MTFIDFFSGIGGFRLGMEQAGHKCKGFVEIDKYAVKSYRAMHNTEGEFYADDVRNVRPEDLPEADCYCGGFPCQAFSIAGKRGGFEDMRGTLVFEIFRLAKVRRPKILFLENVAGLLNHDNGRTFGTIISAMAELGYDAEWQCINSKSYVPQNRERIFIIGRLRGASGREVFPFGDENSGTLKQLIGGSQGDRVYDVEGVSCTLSSQGGGGGAKTGLYLVSVNGENVNIKEYANCLDANYYKGLGCNQERTGVMEVRPCITPDRLEKRQNGRRFKENGEPMFTLTGQDVHGVAILRQVRTEYGKKIRKKYESGEIKEKIGNMRKYELRKDGIANTLSTVDKDNYLYTNYRIRKLTPLECFRLQGFPDELFYKAQAVNSDSQLYKQAGNSVTVPVIYDIAKRIN